MFDMKKSFDRRQVLTVLGIILFLACIPTFLVLFTQYFLQLPALTLRLIRRLLVQLLTCLQLQQQQLL